MDEFKTVLPARFRRPVIQAGGELRRAAADAPDPLVLAALHAAPLGMVVLDNDWNVRLITRMAASLLGLRHGTGAAGKTLLQVAAQSHVLDTPSLQTLSAILHAPNHDGPREALLPIPRPEGSIVVRLDLRRAGDLGWVLSLSEAPEARATAAFLMEQDASDPVTGLANRRHFLTVLRDRLEQRGDRGVAVMRLSLQPRKASQGANGDDPETLGEADHAVLRMASRRIQFSLRSEDLAARFIGREFAVIFTALSGRNVMGPLSDRITDSLSRPFMIEGVPHAIGAHVGLACAPDDGDTPEELLAHAEIALSSARSFRGTGWQIFESQLDHAARHRLEMESSLRAALAHDEFVLHYQPQIELQTGRVRVLEALIRWQNPVRGMVPPNEFIPIAEDVGLICDIGHWVLAHGCMEAARWPEDIALAVNASPLQIEDSTFADQVARALQIAGLPAHRLEIEITENLLLQANAAVNETLERLRDIGVRLVMDDFGTGYASLSQLARFRFNKIKIDRSLISAADSVAEHSAIVRAIAALGVSLCVPTTAEGVETTDQLDRIVQDGCTLVQGYYFSRPVPAEDVPALLEKLGARHRLQEA